MKRLRGVTLIESLVYIALFALLMTGTLLVSYDLLASSTNTSGRNTAQEEGDFALRKLDWMLMGAQTISVLSSTDLKVSKFDGTSAEIEYLNNALYLREGSGSLLPITTSNVSVSAVQFVATSSPLSGVSMSFSIGTNAFTTTKYVRQ